MSNIFNIYTIRYLLKNPLRLYTNKIIKHEMSESHSSLTFNILKKKKDIYESKSKTLNKSIFSSKNNQYSESHSSSTHNYYLNERKV